MLRFNVLGPVEAVRGGDPVALGGPQRRALLAALLLRPNEVWSRDALVDALWDGEGPERAAEFLRSQISRLRKALDPEHDPHAGGAVLRSVPGGYLLAVDPDALDADRFAALLEDGSRALEAGAPESAADLLAEALGLWRGPAFGEFADREFARIEAARLEELRLVAAEHRADALLRSGAHTAAVVEIEAVLDANPYRERMWELYLLGLYRCGRQADALRSYEKFRARLVDEMGVDPSPALRDLERAILSQDPRIDAPGARPGTPSAVPVISVDDRLPFVGREDHLATIAAALERSDLEGRQIVLVNGEPGMGKTRLLAEGARRAFDQGALVVGGRCEQDGDIPYRPFIEGLRRFVESVPPADLPRLLGRGAGELVRLVPDVAELVPTSPREPWSDPETDRYRLFDAVAEWLASASRTQPFAFLIDDLHWATGPTVALVRHLVMSPTTSHILLVGAYRDTDLATNPLLADLLAELHRVPDVIRIRLDGLTSEDVEQLVDRVLEDPEPGLAQRLHADARGNAFLIGEVVRDVAATGALRTPQSIREMVEARLRDLSDPARDVIRAGAVCGTEFHLPIAAAAAQLDDDSAVSALEESAAAGLVVESAEVPDRYQFVHSLVRSTLLEGLSGSRRVRLHHRIGLALEAHGAQVNTTEAELARHFLAAGRAGDADKAVTHALAAAMHALRGFDNTESAALCEQALELAPSSDDRRCDLLVIQGKALRALGRDKHREVLHSAIDLARSRGHVECLADAVLASQREFWSGIGDVDPDRVAAIEDALTGAPEDDPALRVRLLSALAGELGFSGDHRRQRSLSDEAVEIARELGDPATLVDALVAKRLSVWEPDLHERLRLAEELAQLARRLEDPLLRWRALSAAIVPFVEAGGMATAKHLVDLVGDLGDELGDPRPKWAAYYHAALIAQLEGDLGEAERLAHEAAAVSHPGGEVEGLLAHAGQLFFILFDRGELERCAELFEMATEYGRMEGPVLAGGALLNAELGRTGDATELLETLVGRQLDESRRDPLWVITLCLAAEAAARLGHAEAAAAVGPPLEKHGGDIAVVSGFSLGAVDRYLGLAAATCGRTEDALRHYRRALSLHTRVGAAGFGARTRIDWAELLVACDDGSPGEARRLLEEAIVAGEALGHHRIVTRAREVLAREQRVTPGVSPA